MVDVLGCTCRTEVPTHSKLHSSGFTRETQPLANRFKTTSILNQKTDIIKQCFINFWPRLAQLPFVAIERHFLGHFHVWEQALNLLCNLI